MKKLLSIFAILLILLALGIYWVIGNLDSMLKNQIETQGSAALNTNVSVRNVQLDLSTGDGALYGMKIANPKGFKEQSAIKFDVASINLNTQSLQSRPLVIDEIKLDGLKALFEVNEQGDSNLDVLLDHLVPAKEGSPDPTASTSDSNEPSSTSDLRIRVKRFTISNTALGLDLTALGGKQVAQTLPSFVAEDIGGEEGLPPRALGQALGQILLENIARGATRSAMGFIDPDLLKHAEQYTDTLERLNRNLKDAGQDLKKGAKELGDKLKGQLKDWGLKTD